MSFLIGLLILILILGLVAGILIFAIRQMPFIPEPFKSAAIAIVCLILVIVLLGALFGQVPLPWVVGVPHR
jgi:hypothetical protein